MLTLLDVPFLLHRLNLNIVFLKYITAGSNTQESHGLNLNIVFLKWFFAPEPVEVSVSLNLNIVFLK